jgi:hypothetical protein
MSEGTVTQWCRMFKNGRINVHDEEWSGQPFVVSYDLVQSERLRFTISAENCFGLHFIRAVPQRWRRISQSHRMSTIRVMIFSEQGVNYCSYEYII